MNEEGVAAMNEEGVAAMNRQLLRGDAFCLEIDGLSTAGFARCVGLEASRRVVAYREGGCDGERLFDDGITPGRITLERGVTRDRALWEWFESGDRRDSAVVLLDGKGEERSRWWLRQAFPSRWEGPELNAKNAEIALETLEITFEAMEWSSD